MVRFKFLLKENDELLGEMVNRIEAICIYEELMEYYQNYMRHLWKQGHSWSSTEYLRIEIRRF